MDVQGALPRQGLRLSCWCMLHLPALCFITHLAEQAKPFILRFVAIPEILIPWFYLMLLWHIRVPC